VAGHRARWLDRGHKKTGQLLARAFAPQSVLIYVAGFLIFAVVPYFLLFRTTPTNMHGWKLFCSPSASPLFSRLHCWLVVTVKAIALLNFQAPKSPEPVANEAA